MLCLTINLVYLLISVDAALWLFPSITAVEILLLWHQVTLKENYRCQKFGFDPLSICSWLDVDINAGIYIG